MKRYTEITFALFLILLPLTALPDPWEKLPEPHLNFCTNEFLPVVNLYQEGKPDEAIKRLDEAFTAAEKSFPNELNNPSSFLYLIVWWEAQVRTGNHDEEWGLRLFEYLFERDCKKHPEYKTKIPARHFPLYSNLIERARLIGKSAMARKWVLCMEESLCRNQGLNTRHPEVYTDLGPLFDFLPEIRDREFPMNRQDLLNGRSGKEPHLMYYTYMYGVQHVAITAMDSGEWKRAAELHNWYLKFSAAYAEQKRELYIEVLRNGFDSTHDLAQLCLLFGRPDEAIQVYQNYIDLVRTHMPDRISDPARACLEQELIRMKEGAISENAIEIADHAVESVNVIKFYPRDTKMAVELKRARVYHHAPGRRDQAWAIVSEMLDRGKADVNPYLWTCILNTAVDLAMDDGATNPALEDWLILAIENERLRGDKFAELDLYEKYAKFLYINGRITEAIEMQKEAVRLANATDLTWRLQQAEKTLSSYIANQATEKDPQPPAAAPTSRLNPEVAQIENQQPGATPHAPAQQPQNEDCVALPVILQPSTTLCASLPGHLSFGRFYLINPSSFNQAGTLRLSGRMKQPFFKSSEWLIVGASATDAPSDWEEPIILEAGSCCIIDFTGTPSSDGVTSSIICDWIPDHDTDNPIRSTWSYCQSPSENRTAVIDAHDVKQNPFYLIPIRHMIQQDPLPVDSTVDFRIKASQPTRIEMYDESTGKLLAVDANGDGDFEDKGDQVFSDRNWNNIPDINLPANSDRASITLYVRPHKTSSDADNIELTVSLMDAGSWRNVSVDIIRTK